MGNTFGKNIKLSIFGESHGAGIGIVIDGLPHGFCIDWAAVDAMMARRAPGIGDLSTPRKESDAYEVLSGIFEGKTTGAPLAVVIRNNNTKSGDYQPNLMRPGHADFTAYHKYDGFADYRGGGHFSGRITAPLVFAGAIAMQILESHGVKIGARIAAIRGIRDGTIADIAQICDASKKPFPVYDDSAGERMKQAIADARDEGDSVGGIIECAAIGLPIGLGEPFFGSLESAISAMMFSIPAVKGVEFGAGFGIAEMLGSEANDTMHMENGEVCINTNNNGGINGGISNGNPLVCRIAVKPTPTISKPQTTVDIVAGETKEVQFGGRHDPCIVPRAVPVAEAAMALCILDFCEERTTKL